MSDEKINDKVKLDLTSVETYMTSTLGHLKWQLDNFFEDNSKYSLEHIQNRIAELNEYENIEHLKPLTDEHIEILDDETIDVAEAEKVILNGEFFWETAAAGEATRLGLGTKYCLKLSDLSLKSIIDMRTDEIKSDFKDDPDKAIEMIAELTEENLTKQIGCRPEETLPISLGVRHMIQMVYDVRKLARKHGLDEDSVVKKQKVLLILNETTNERIVKEVLKYNFFTLNPDNFFFMVQKNFPGIDFNSGEPYYDKTHENHKRLHNHGQMAMQKVHDNEIFRLDSSGERNYISYDEFEKALAMTKVLLSYNVEDIGYLANSIDLPALALSLHMKDKGHNMTMEVVAQNPHKPQKGGACFYDAKKERPIMIESNQLKDLDVAEITHLNKNFNHYMDPVTVFRELKKGELRMHTDVKKAKDASGNTKHYLYFCTPQGDINFIVSTAYVMRKNLKPIQNWKSPATTAPTVKACRDQDLQPGFKEFASEVLGETFN